MPIGLKLRTSVLAIGVVALALGAQAAPGKPTGQQIAALKKLAQQSVLHVETGLKKIEASGATADQAKMMREVYKPAQDLLKEWKSFDLTDAFMSNYGSCMGILGDVQAYGREATTPPKYHLSPVGLQKKRFIDEDLAECRKLRSTAPTI